MATDPGGVDTSFSLVKYNEPILLPPDGSNGWSVYCWWFCWNCHWFCLMLMSSFENDDWWPSWHKGQCQRRRQGARQVEQLNHPSPKVSRRWKCHNLYQTQMDQKVLRRSITLNTISCATHKRIQRRFAIAKTPSKWQLYICHMQILGAEQNFASAGIWSQCKKAYLNQK